MDNIGKETQGGSLRGFVIGRRNNYLREATPNKLESLQDFYVDSLHVQKTCCQEKLGQCKNLYHSHGKKMDEDGNQTLFKFGLFKQLERF
jgi:hypothetical protein